MGRRIPFAPEPWLCVACNKIHGASVPRSGVVENGEMVGPMCDRQANKRHAQQRREKQARQESRLIEEIRSRHPSAFARLRGHKAQYARALELWAAEHPHLTRRAA